jgi:uridylate kinase
MAQQNKPLNYQRILVKISGEALQGHQQFGIDPKVLDRVAKEIGELAKLNVQIGMVIGGGNLCRGHTLSKAGIGRISADQMGMLATIMNAIAMRDALERAGFSSRIMSAIPMSGVVDHYDRRKAIHHLQQGRIVIFSAGTGNPLFTTDSAASLRAIEIEADMLLKATNVEGVYSADPARDPNAILYQRLSYSTALAHELGVMDLAAFCQCRDHQMKIRVFNITKPNALIRIIQGENEGTLIEGEPDA